MDLFMNDLDLSTSFGLFFDTKYYLKPRNTRFTRDKITDIHERTNCFEVAEFLNFLLYLIITLGSSRRESIIQTPPRQGALTVRYCKKAFNKTEPKKENRCERRRRLVVVVVVSQETPRDSVLEREANRHSVTEKILKRIGGFSSKPKKMRRPTSRKEWSLFRWKISELARCFRCQSAHSGIDLLYLVKSSEHVRSIVLLAITQITLGDRLLLLTDSW